MHFHSRRRRRLVLVFAHGLPPANLKGVKLERSIQVNIVGLAMHLFAPRSVWCATRALVGVGHTSVPIGRMVLLRLLRTSACDCHPTLYMHYIYPRRIL